MGSAGALLDLLGDEVDRRILELTDERTRSAEEVAEECDASLPTVYRHVDDLASAGLLTEHTQFDTEGNHYKTYDTALEEVTIRVEDGDLTVDVAIEADAGGQEVDDAPTPEGVEAAGGGHAAEEIERPSTKK